MKFRTTAIAMAVAGTVAAPVAVQAGADEIYASARIGLWNVEGPEKDEDGNFIGDQVHEQETPDNESTDKERTFTIRYEFKRRKGPPSS